ncbi:MAG: hypothetical protein QM791_17620 [Ferruginibacter sp.]
MENTSHNSFDNAIVVAGLKLLKDFSTLTPLSLQVMLANMQFVLKKEFSSNNIALYSSQMYNSNESTLILVNINNVICKVRYLNINIERFF